ncbi:DUF922 domain-containing protein [Mesorhizobium sp. NBSH29]|nr:DUF922 domain-containing protein [Mesorhizobium sp. NBSH29]
MRGSNGIFLSAVLTLSPVPLFAAEWKASEVEKPYAISGSDGLSLYQSIGENGPQLAIGTRTVAHTTFVLKWSRNYQPQGNACTLVAAKPFLTITYTLPKPSAKLTGETAQRWSTFIEGIRAHEKVHGEHIKELVRTIEATTVGVTVENDRDCKKIRQQLQVPLKAASDRQRQQGRDFDAVEMADGGNIHQLIIGLVKEP